MSTPTLESLIRRRLSDEGHRQIVLTRLAAGGWQVSVLRPSGSAFGMEISRDPADALWNVLCDLEHRRTPAADAEDLIG